MEITAVIHFTRHKDTQGTDLECSVVTVTASTAKLKYN